MLLSDAYQSYWSNYYVLTTSEIMMCRYIGFLPFNKPAGLTLLKLVKLLGAAVIWLYPNETGFKDVQFITQSIV